MPCLIVDGVVLSEGPSVNLWLAAYASQPSAKRGSDVLSVDSACRTPNGGAFGRCGAEVTPRMLKRWGTLLAATPRAVFGTAEAPPAARR